MPTLTLNINNVEFTKTITDEQVLAIVAAKDRVNNTITEDADKWQSKEDYFTTLITNWANQTSASNTEISNMIDQCVNSWSETPIEIVEESHTLTEDELKSFLLAYCSNKHWTKEVSGMTINGINIPTDDRAKLLLMGAASYLADDAVNPLVIGGDFVSLTGAQFKAIYGAMVQRTQSLFADRAAIITLIKNGSVTTTEQIDQYNWTE